VASHGKRVLWIVLLLAALVLTTGFRLVQGGDSTLASGETYEGTLVFTGGNYTIEQGATVDGDVWMIGGNVLLNGEITGDVRMYGGNMVVSPGASIGGQYYDERTEGDGDVFNVVDVGFLPCACCCGLPLLLIVILLIVLLSRRGKGGSPQMTTGVPPQGTPPSDGTS
jgi:hypothetical protein